MKDNRRLLTILEFLHRNTDEHNFETTVSIMDHLKEKGIPVDRKTLGKDIQELQEIGFGIVKTKSSPNKYAWIDRLFVTAELQVLMDAVLSARFISEKKSRELIRKLAKLTSDNNALVLHKQMACTDRTKTDNLQMYRTINVLIRAINNHKRIQFKYIEYDRNKEKVYKNNGRSYFVSPYKLYCNNDNYYLIGWDRKHNGVTVFRIDRIESIRTTEGGYVSQPEDFSIAAYAKKYFSMFDGEELKVELEVENDLMKYILDRFGKNVYTFIDEDRKDVFYVRTSVKASPTFYAWVFQFGGKIKIIGPEEAVRGFKEMLDKNHGE